MSDGLIITERMQLTRRRVLEIESAVMKAVDGICEKENNEVTYAEINCAMLNVMRTFNAHEIKILNKKKVSKKGVTKT